MLAKTAGTVTYVSADRVDIMNVEGRAYEYKMSAECARNILKDRKGNDAKKNPQQYLCEYVTEQYGLLGTCVKVLTY